MTPRPKGTGSVYRRASDGLWVGSLEAGWTREGRRRRITVTSTSKREAMQKLRDKERQIAREGLPMEGRQTARTIKAYAEKWLEDTSHRLAPSTWTANRSALTHWIIPTIGHRRLDQLTATDVRAVTQAITSAGRTATTAQRAHAVLTTMLKAAAVDGITIPQGALLTRPPVKGETDRDAIPIPHIRRILQEANQLPERSLYYASFLQGMRPAEVRGLTWDCVDMTASTIDVSWQMKALPYRVARDRASGFRIPAHHEVLQVEGRWHLARPKTAAGRRVIPMVPYMVDLLREWQAIAPQSPAGLVWPDAGGGPLDDKDHRAAWRALCAAAGVQREDGPTVRPYDLYEARHSTASLLKHLGVADEVIVRIMGHSSINSTRAYIHVPLDDARRALAGVATLLIDA